MNVANKCNNNELIKYLDKRTNDLKGDDIKRNDYIKHIVHYFSNCVLSDEEYKVLYYRLDHHISSASFYNAFNTKFELFYQNLLTNISHIPNNRLFLLKIKIRNTCHKYKKITVPYKYKQVIRKLSKYENIGILRQDKEGGWVVIMGSSKYMPNFLDILDSEQFVKIYDNRTKPIEGKIQRCIRKIRNKVSKDECSKIYPTGSSPGKFYVLAKMHKLPKNIKDLEHYVH